MSLNSQEITDLMKNVTAEDEKLIQKALNFAKSAHKGQFRMSGEEYITHPFETAKILAEMNADVDTIVAGLIHDTVEDNRATKEEIKEEFGETILFLVEGVTKLGKLKYQGLKRHVESLRKLFIAMANDIRVIMIRLADRLHNVRTLEALPIEKRERIAWETLEIYAPIANRLGMWRIKGVLEDASFPFVYPKEYAEVIKLRKTKGKETVKKLEKIHRTLRTELAKQGFNDVVIDYRLKYLYSLFRKLRQKDMDIDQIHDISALRIIVPDLPDCYRALGVVHSVYRPVPGRLKDYIAHPKPNGYQSIHTAIFSGDSMVEVQIRSQLMHEEAEYGIASHIKYDEQGKISTPKLSGKTRWIDELIEWQKDIQEEKVFLNTLKNRFFKNQIFVFTPKGDVVELPEGSTTIDFAYAIHSDIGDHAGSAKVNGKLVSLNTKLKNEDVVEIEMKKTSKPTFKWLNFVKTGSARKHIRQFLSQKKEG